MCVDTLVPVRIQKLEPRELLCLQERKYVLTLQVQLNDRSGVAIDTGIVKIIVRIKFPKKSFKPVLNWLTVWYRPAHRFLRAPPKRLNSYRHV